MPLAPWSVGSCAGSVAWSVGAGVVVGLGVAPGNRSASTAAAMAWSKEIGAAMPDSPAWRSPVTSASA